MRSKSHLPRADAVRTLVGVERMKGIRSASRLDEPPAVLRGRTRRTAAGWRARPIAIFGRKWGTEPSRSIARRSDLCLRDYAGEVCLGNETLYFATHPFWSNLSVRADDCKRCWPDPVDGKEPNSRPLAAARRPSDSEVLAFMEEKRQMLRTERKRAGRDVLLRVAINHFGLSRKVALDIWNRAARDRKGGRPKNVKPGMDTSIVRRAK